MDFLEKILGEIKPPACLRPPPVKARSLIRAIRTCKLDLPLIAEIKFRSPSGTLREFTDPGELAVQMVEGGAIALSVLTEGKYFGGSPSFIEQVKRRVSVPILRKDFIVYESQIYESAKVGADVLLLLAGALGRKLGEFIKLTEELGMEPLVEISNERELSAALECGARSVGINNRDLHTLEVDLGRTLHLAPLVPEEVVVVSESGIGSHSEAMRMVEAGADAVLVGTRIMRAPDVREAVRELVYGEG